MNVLFFLVEIVVFAFLFTAVFNRTGGSLLVVILLHTSINLTDTFLPASTLAAGLWKLLILILAVWMWRSPQAFSAPQVESN